MCYVSLVCTKDFVFILKTVFKSHPYWCKYFVLMTAGAYHGKVSGCSSMNKNTFENIFQKLFQNMASNCLHTMLIYSVSFNELYPLDNYLNYLFLKKN